LLFFTGQHSFSNVTELTLRDCHALKLEKMFVFLTFLPCLEYLTLQDMFREPPKGCSRYLVFIDFWLVWNSYMTYIGSNICGTLFYGFHWLPETILEMTLI